jgi:hypothetical protein
MNMDLPQRIEIVRRYDIAVSDDGFYGTPTGPVHINDSELARVLLVHEDLLAALKSLCDFIDNEGPAATQWKAISEWCEKGRAAIAKAEGGGA